MLAKSLVLGALIALVTTAAASAADQSDPVQYETVIAAPMPQTPDTQPVVTASMTEPGRS